MTHLVVYISKLTEYELHRHLHYHNEMTPPANWVYMTRTDERIIPLGDGIKAASISLYRGKPFFHLRQFYGESFLKFPTKYGICLNRQELLQLFELRESLLADFDRLQVTDTSTAATVDHDHNQPIMATKQTKQDKTTVIADPSSSSITELAPPLTVPKRKSQPRKRLRLDI